MKTIIQVEQEPQLNVSVEESTENILVNVFQSPDINIEVCGIVYGDSNVDLSNYWTKTESDSKYKPIGYVPTWNSITGKPIFFSGNYNDLTNKPTLFNGTWASLSGTPTTIEGYGITNAFDGDYNSLSNKPTNFTPSTHTHDISDVTNLQTTLNNKLDKGGYIGTAQDLYDYFEGENIAQDDLINDLSSEIAYENVRNDSQDSRLESLEGINYTWSPTNRTLTLFDRVGNQLSQVSLVSLDNEGTDLRYNSTTLSLELYNADNELLDSIPVSSFIGSVGTQLQLNSNQLQLRDSQGNILSTVSFTVSNIQGLQTLLDGKLDKGTYTGTAQDLKNDVDNIQIGGRNLLKKSAVEKSKSAGWITYELTEKFEGTYTIQLWIENTIEGEVGIGFGTAGGFDGNYFDLPILKNGIYTKTFTNLNSGNNTHLTIYVNNNTTIKKAKLERGNKATDWTPAPEDKQDNLQTITDNVGVGKTNTSATEKLDVNGNVKATSFIKSGGTSSQFLMADGNVIEKSTIVNGYALANGTNATNNWGNTSSGLSLNPSLTGKTLNASGQNVDLRDATYGQISGIVQDDTNGPEVNQWSNRLKTLHDNSTGYFTELAQNFTGTEGVWHRRNKAGTISSWKQLYDDSIWNAASLSHSGSTLTLTINGISKTTTINAGTSYTLPTASATVLGGVKIGSGISIDGNGVISANTNTYTAGTNITISGNTISVVASPTFSGSIKATSFFESSLSKYKTNIKKFDKSGIDLIDSLEIVTFDRIDSDVKSKIGIIADDSPEEFLSENRDSVDLYKTVFIQAKAIQELTEEVNNLRELLMTKLNQL